MLVPFLRTAVNPLTGQSLGVWFAGDVRATGWRFWPRLAHPNCTPCEPDVELSLTDGNGPLLLLIESKYRSGKSSFATGDEHERPNDQLAREFDNLKRAAGTGRCAVVYVTTDPYCPEAEIRESAAEYRTKRGSDPDIFWTSWRFLAPLLEVVTLTRPGMLRDMCDLLLSLDLTTFTRLRTSFATPAWAFHRAAATRRLWAVPPLTWSFTGGTRSSRPQESWRWRVPSVAWRFDSNPATVCTNLPDWQWALPQPNSFYKWGTS